MLNKTPLRLIAIEESPHDDDDEQGGGAPVISISDEQAITRKVPEAAMIAAHESLAEARKRFPSWHKLVPAGVVALVLIVFVVALVRTGSKPGAPAPAAAAAPAPTRAAPPPLAAPVTTPSPVPAQAIVTPPSPVPALPDLIRLEIDASPVETEVSLDGNVVAGHHLSLQVPRDRGIHVISASARGYLPFNQQVSFASDVVLKINLRRAQGSAVRAAPRARPAAVEPRPKGETRAAPAAAGPRIEPGMSLDGPSRRPHAKSIDERNPYQP